MAERELKIRVTSKTDEAKRDINSFGASLGTLATMAAGAFAAFETGRRIIDATVGATMQYARQVRDLSATLGTSAEETSRVIQVMDDFEIEAGQLETALRTLRQTGVTPNIEGLAQLSDQFLALNPGIDRTNFLMTNFGRQGVQFATLMQRGGDAIRQMSDAVGDNLILNEEAIQATEDYRLALDDLNDEILGVKLSIGQALIPALTELLRNLNGVEDAAGRTAAELRHMPAEAHQLAVLEAAGRDAAGGIGEGARAANAVRDAINLIPTTHDTTLTATFRTQILDDYARRLLDMGWWHVFSGGVFTAGAGGQAVLGGGGGGGGGGLTASQQAANQWRRAQGYTPMTQEQLVAAGYRAGGGLLNSQGWSVVGEAGPELISPWGEVIPTSATVRMMSAGLHPKNRLAYGEEGGGAATIELPPVIGGGLLGSAVGITSAGLINALIGAGVSSASLGVTAAGAVAAPAATGSTIAALGAVVETASETAATQAATRIGTQIPAAVLASTQQTTLALTSVQSRGFDTMVRELRALRRDVNKLNRTLPTTFRDSVERLIS